MRPVEARERYSTELLITEAILRPLVVDMDGWRGGQ